MAIGLKIKKLREERRLTQEYVADKMGISQNAYSKLENNQSKLSIDRLKQLAEVLDVPDYELLSAESNVFNFNNNQTANAYAVYEAASQLYEDTIKHLKEEIEACREEKKRLLAVIEKLTK